MTEKTCFKCGEKKHIDCFYIHKAMKDGHLNKCKECTKKDTRLSYDIKSSNEEYREKERERGRDRYKRLGYRDKQKIWDSKRLNRMKPIFKRLHKMYKNKYGICENEVLHHWDYNLPYNVFVMDRDSHRKLHTRLVPTAENDMFTYNGVLLDTADKHKSVIFDILWKSFRHIDE